MKQTTKTKLIISLSILFLVILIVSSVYFIYNFNINYNSEEQYSDLTATRIIDGDTFELASGDIIRLICVDTPEKGEEGYEEASDFLFSLIYNKEVRLEKDIEDKDAYGRLLRYVYLNNSEKVIFVNKEIVSNGYGELFIYGNNTLKCGEIANEQ